MKIRTRKYVAENQRVFVFKDEQLEKVLTPGKHTFWGGQKRTFLTFDINDLYFAEANAARLYRQNTVLHAHLQHWQLGIDEAGLLYVNEKLRGIVAPGEQIFIWKDAATARLETVNIQSDIRVDSQLLTKIQRAGVNNATKLIASLETAVVKPIADVTVQHQHIGLVYRDGELIDTLAPGLHGFWQFDHHINVKTYDTRAQLIDISGQEILSKDRVTLRINLNANVIITDPIKVANRVNDVNDFIYKHLQLALREAVGTKTLDDILLDKLYVNETVKELVVPVLDDVGVTLKNVGVKDIILPGEMKAILNQVVEAQKTAEANVIKRREETSATRSLHNTAKVMENNPTLLRLKELEALEKVAEKIDNLTIYGGLDGLMQGTIKLDVPTN
ncbi:slipin family protein [Thaumasiovibrio subtropicus]|uniref:slipin family protein n=1 Tax=Thaumasiovibrio subtropicus TaxID=1891207 RepID=UPI000B35E99B|nr:slipin family protein [Thaumasiovibrio subtropicus]